MLDLFDYLDHRKLGHIGIDPLLELVKGLMNDFRRSVVAQVFLKLDFEGRGYLNIDDFPFYYSTRHHPLVVSGAKTESQISDELVQSFEDYLAILVYSIDQGIQDRKISQEEFEDYFSYISPSISSDKTFEAQLNEAWHPARIINRGFRRTEQADEGQDDFKKTQQQPHRAHLPNRSGISHQRPDDPEIRSIQGSSRHHGEHRTGTRNTHNSGNDHRICSNHYVPHLPLENGEAERETECKDDDPINILRKILFKRGPKIAVSLKKQLQVG